MKNLVIIGTHPNEEYKMRMLDECIDMIKPLGYDIMVCSHSPISESIQKKIDYFVYDKNNLTLNPELTPKYVFHNENFTFVNPSKGGHILAVCKNIVNGINFANDLKYNFFFYMESDNLMSNHELSKIELCRRNMLINEKKMIFFTYENEGKPIYETLIFGGLVSYFRDNHNLPTDMNSFGLEIRSLESLLYKRYQNVKDNFYLIPISSKEYFSDSRINLEYEKYLVSLCLSNSKPHYYLFIQNLLINPSKIEVSINGDTPREFANGIWSFRPVVMNSELNVKVVCDGFEKLFEFSEFDYMDYPSRGYLYFKN